LASAFVDDIIIAAPKVPGLTLDEAFALQLQAIRAVLGALRGWADGECRKKSRFAVKTLQFLGHDVSEAGVQPAEALVGAGRDADAGDA